LGIGSEQDAKPAAWLRLTHTKDGSYYGASAIEAEIFISVEPIVA